MVSTVMSIDKQLSVNTTVTFATLTPTNDTVARGRNSARNFYQDTLCANSAEAKAG